LARQYTRNYVVFEDQVEHVGREMRRRFPGREGQEHPLVWVRYTREGGKVTSIISLNMNYVRFDEDGRVGAFIPTGSRGKGGEGCKVVDIKDYKRLNLTGLQLELLTIRLLADFGLAMGNYVMQKSL
jgi:hypothetical protein